MPTSAQASVGMTWLLRPCYKKTLSNRTDPKNPKGFGKVRVSSVRERIVQDDL